MLESTQAEPSDELDVHVDASPSGVESVGESSPTPSASNFMASSELSASYGQPTHRTSPSTNVDPPPPPLTTFRRRCPSYASTLLNNEQQEKGRRAQRTLLVISVVTLAFVCAELVGGYLAHSLAIMTDAFHMLSDLLSFIVSIVAIGMSRRRPTARHPYGFHRAEVLGALSSVLMIWALTALLVYAAVQRIIEDNLDVDTVAMMWTAAAGVAFNIVIGLLLFVCESGGHHTHSHFGSVHHHHHHHHHDNVNFVVDEAVPTPYFTNATPPPLCGAARKASSALPPQPPFAARGAKAKSAHHAHRHSNLNIRAAFVHAVGDLVQSAGVLLAAILIHFTGFRLADPICTFVFGGLVLLTTAPVMRDVIDVLMEATPAHIDLAKVYSDLTSVDGVIAVHNLRIWSLKSDAVAVSLHLELSAEGAGRAPLAVGETRAILQGVHHFHFVTIQTLCPGASVVSAAA